MIAHHLSPFLSRLDMALSNNKTSKAFLGKPISLTLLAITTAFLTACNGSAPNNTAESKASTAVSNSKTSVKANTASTPTSCLEQFHQTTPPTLQKENSKKANYALCYQGFSVLYSGVSKTPLWVAEYLTPERLSVKIKREDSFHEETRIPAQHRALLNDYRGSGYDRGHMAPNADMNNTESQYDSFTLTNMVPQAAKNNQDVWRSLEGATRNMVTKYKQSAYVITGPTYEGKEIQQIGKGVLVPTAVYKAIYFPDSGVIGAYYAENHNQVETAELMSVCALERKIGINLFPHLDDEKKRQIYDLPLSAGAIKANQPIKLLKTDNKGKCADPVSAEQQKWQQQQFKPNNFKELSYPQSTTSSKKLKAQESA